MRLGNSNDERDEYYLTRFVEAQSKSYDQALSEIHAGRKLSHWMWYIFPQYTGLGASPASQFYAIKSIAEAKAYLQHPILGPRLLECFKAVLHINDRSAYEIFGSPDDVKLRSCVTLFNHVSTDSVFGEHTEKVLAQYFEGLPDPRTLQLIKAQAS